MLISHAMILRPYQRADLDAMFQLDEVCFAEPFRFSLAAMRRYAEARHAQVLIADEGGELAGFTIVHRECAGRGFLAYLLTIDVAPASRLQGLAQRLLMQAETDARAAGCSAMLLHVFTGNANAIAFYAKLGYERLQVEENFYGRGVHAWIYRKRLMSVRAGDAMSTP